MPRSASSRRGRGSGSSSGSTRSEKSKKNPDSKPQASPSVRGSHRGRHSASMGGLSSRSEDSRSAPGVDNKRLLVRNVPDCVSLSELESHLASVLAWEVKNLHQDHRAPGSVLVTLETPADVVDSRVLLYQRPLKGVALELDSVAESRGVVVWKVPPHVADVDLTKRLPSHCTWQLIYYADLGSAVALFARKEDSGTAMKSLKDISTSLEPYYDTFHEEVFRCLLQDIPSPTILRRRSRQVTRGSNTRSGRSNQGQRSKVKPPARRHQDDVRRSAGDSARPPHGGERSKKSVSRSVGEVVGSCSDVHGCGNGKGKCDDPKRPGREDKPTYGSTGESGNDAVKAGVEGGGEGGSEDKDKRRGSFHHTDGHNDNENLAEQSSDRAGFESGNGEVKAEFESGNGEVKAGSESGNGGVKAGSESRNGGVKAGSESGNGEVKAGFESGNGEVKAGSESGEGDKPKAGSESGNGKVKAEFESGNGEVKAGVESGEGDKPKAGSESGDGKVKAGFESGNGEVKAGSESGNGEVKAGSESGNGEVKAGSESGNGDVKAGSASGDGDESKAETNTLPGDETAAPESVTFQGSAHQESFAKTDLGTLVEEEESSQSDRDDPLEALPEGTEEDDRSAGAEAGYFYPNEPWRLIPPEEEHSDQESEDAEEAALRCSQFVYSDDESVSDVTEEVRVDLASLMLLTESRYLNHFRTCCVYPRWREKVILLEGPPDDVAAAKVELEGIVNDIVTESFYVSPAMVEVLSSYLGNEWMLAQVGGDLRSSGVCLHVSSDGTLSCASFCADDAILASANLKQGFFQYKLDLPDVKDEEWNARWKQTLEEVERNPLIRVITSGSAPCPVSVEGCYDDVEVAYVQLLQIIEEAPQSESPPTPSSTDADPLPDAAEGGQQVDMSAQPSEGSEPSQTKDTPEVTPPSGSDHLVADCHSGRRKRMTAGSQLSDSTLSTGDHSPSKAEQIHAGLQPSKTTEPNPGHQSSTSNRPVAKPSPPTDSQSSTQPQSTKTTKLGEDPQPASSAQSSARPNVSSSSSSQLSSNINPSDAGLSGQDSEHASINRSSGDQSPGKSSQQYDSPQAAVEGPCRSTLHQRSQKRAGHAERVGDRLEAGRPSPTSKAGDKEPTGARSSGGQLPKAEKKSKSGKNKGGTKKKK